MVLSAPACLPFLRPSAAWAAAATAAASASAAPQLGGGGSAPPSGSSGGGSGGGGGDGWQLSQRRAQEAAQLAESRRPILLTLVSFAVTRKAYGKITKMFIREYEEQTGRTVRFRLSFGGSGTQARAVIDGLPAEIAALALPLDTIKIADAGGAAHLPPAPACTSRGSARLPLPGTPLPAEVSLQPSQPQPSIEGSRSARHCTHACRPDPPGLARRLPQQLHRVRVGVRHCGARRQPQEHPQLGGSG